MRSASAVGEVEVDLVRDAGSGQELDQDRDVVARSAAGPAHRVRAVVDARVEAAREHRCRSRSCSRPSRVTRPRSIARVRPRDDRVGGRFGVESAQPERRCQVVAGPGRDDAQRDAGARRAPGWRGARCRRRPATTTASVPSAMAVRSSSLDSAALPPLMIVVRTSCARRRSAARVADPVCAPPRAAGLTSRVTFIRPSATRGRTAGGTSTPGFMMPRGSTVAFTARRIGDAEIADLRLEVRAGGLARPRGGG